MGTARQSAAKNKITHKGERKEDWLEYAAPEYSAKLRSDIRVMLRVLLLFVPLPIFWALYDQQGSRWTFQVGAMENLRVPCQARKGAPYGWKGIRTRTTR